MRLATITAFLFSLIQFALADPNPLSAIDVEKLAAQIAGSDSFREDVRKVFGSLTGATQASARKLIDAMAGPQRMQASSTPIDAIAARHLTSAIAPLVQDADTRAIVQLHGDAGRLDLLLTACTATSKPTIAEDSPSNQKATTAQKRVIEKAFTGHFVGPKGDKAVHYFGKDGTLLVFAKDDPPRANVHKWQILKDGTVASDIYGFNHFWRLMPDNSVQYVKYGVYVDGQPDFQKAVPWEIDLESTPPKKYALVNK